MENSSQSSHISFWNIFISQYSFGSSSSRWPGSSAAAVISGLAIGCRAKRRPLVGKNDEMNQPLVKNLGDRDGRFNREALPWSPVGVQRLWRPTTVVLYLKPHRRALQKPGARGAAFTKGYVAHGCCATWRRESLYCWKEDIKYKKL